LEKEPRHFFAALNRAVALGSLERNAEAKEQLEDLLRQMPSWDVPLFNHSVVCNQLGRELLARGSCRKLIALDPSYPGIDQLRRALRL
jgi:hypothetical protein